MDTELLYLTKRANFHRRMARGAACGEARRAHRVFVEAYLHRIDNWKCPLHVGQAGQYSAAGATRPVAPIAVKPELLA